MTPERLQKLTLRMASAAALFERAAGSLRTEQGARSELYWELMSHGDKCRDLSEQVADALRESPLIERGSE